MSHILRGALPALVLLTAISGCVAGPGGVGYDPYDGNSATFATDPGYFAPPGMDYGGWGSGFAIGPYGRGGGDRFRGDERQHAFHSAPAGRSVPSVPQAVRGGGNRETGSRGGGGRPGGAASSRPGGGNDHAH